MVLPFLLILPATAPDQNQLVTAADIGLCIDSKSEKFSTSNDSTAVVADQVVAACARYIAGWCAARDALLAKEAGPVPPSNSAAFKKAVTSSFRQSALRSVERARRLNRDPA